MVSSNQDQETFVNNCRNIELKKGDFWYVISNKWFERWSRHVKYGDDQPGPIDNSDILYDPAIRELKNEMLENIDFVFVPTQCWDYLVELYGVSDNDTAIYRKVIEFGEFTRQLKVDLSGLKVKLMYEDKSVKKILSKGDTIGEVCAMMKKEFSLKDGETRLYAKKMSDSYILLDRPGDTLDKCNISENQCIILEEKAGDGTWSKKFSTSTKVMSNFEKNSNTAFGTFNKSSQHSESVSTRSMTNNHVGRGADAGLVGLNNLGNTCFMASGLQCLSNTPALTEFFISNRYEGEINEKNPIGNRGELARAYGELMKQMWSGSNNSVAPRHFKSVLGRCAPQFSGYLQQDSQELLAFLLDGMHEDLNRITHKPYVNTTDQHENMADAVAAQQAWDNHKKRNDSVMTDLFHGQYRSRLQCPDCQKISKIFDPFMFMSVSLPRKEDKIKEVDIVWLNPDRKRTRYKVLVPREGVVSDLYRAMEEASGLSRDRMMLVEISSSIIEQTFQPNHNLRDIREGRCSLCILERDPALPVIKVYNCYKGYTSYLKYFGNPMVMQFDKIPYKDFAQQLLDNMRRYVDVKEMMDVLPLDVITVNQFGAEQSHSLEDEEGNVNLTLATGKQVTTLAVVWTSATRDKYFNLEESNSIEYDQTYHTTKSRRQEILLEECIELYCKEEVLNADNMWYCPHCKDFKQATKKLDLWRLPQVLVLHLKRFNYSRQWRDKVDTPVKYPLKGLNINKFVKSADQSDAEYDLVGVVNHFGGLGGGHYTATCRHEPTGKWHVYDDSHVSECPESKAQSASAYVLFYVQRQPNANGHSEPMEVDI